MQIARTLLALSMKDAEAQHIIFGPFNVNFQDIDLVCSDFGQETGEVDELHVNFLPLQMLGCYN